MQDFDGGIDGRRHSGGTKQLQVIFWNLEAFWKFSFRRTVMIERQGVVVA
jgi:hypothetical protein